MIYNQELTNSLIGIFGNEVENWSKPIIRNKLEDKVDVILRITPFISDFENVAETGIGDAGHTGPAPFNQRVGGQCRAMNEPTDIGPVFARLLQHMPRPGKRTVGWIGRRCGCFG